VESLLGLQLSWAVLLRTFAHQAGQLVLTLLSMSQFRMAEGGKSKKASTNARWQIISVV
jgi:hypothetical protein